MPDDQGCCRDQPASIRIVSRQPEPKADEALVRVLRSSLGRRDLGRLAGLSRDELEVTVHEAARNAGVPEDEIGSQPHRCQGDQ